MKLAYVFLFSVLFFGCEAFYRVPPATVGSNINQPPIPTNTSPENAENNPVFQQIPKWGVVKCHEEQYNLFNKELKKFLSATINPQTVQAVNCTDRTDIKGGMFIKGSVTFEGGAVFDPSSNTQYLDVANSSSIEIHIVGIDNRLIKAFKMKALPYGSLVEGNLITLALHDDEGKVFLEGSVENKLFTGVLKYENNTTYQGRSGFSGSIGRFSIYACELLQCKPPSPN